MIEKGSIYSTINRLSFENYHQKYMLQQHPTLMSALNAVNITKSHICTRINGYLGANGKTKDFDKEWEILKHCRVQVFWGKMKSADIGKVQDLWGGTWKMLKMAMSRLSIKSA